jgi:hypothetical protein
MGCLVEEVANPLLGCSEEEAGRELEARIRTISWLPLPLLMLFTVAFNVGMGSLTWVVATEAGRPYLYIVAR